MTEEQLKILNLDLPNDAKTNLILESALEWISENTIIDTADLAKLPAGAKLFMLKFYELYGKQSGVASESIEGLSMSFNTSDMSSMLWDIAENLLGQYLKGRVRFVSASPRWRG